MNVLLLITTALLVSASAANAATVREAHVSIGLTPNACTVAMRLIVDTADPAVIDHTLLLDEPGHPPVFTVVGAVAGQAGTTGRIAKLPISLTAMGRNEYAVRYRVNSTANPESGTRNAEPGTRNAELHRCPLLIPSAPTDGLARAISISVAAPPELMRLPGEFPAFTWNGSHGRVTLGHFPSFVRVPLARRGAALTWRQSLDPRFVVDALAIVTIASASLAWVAFRKARG